jgi:hypothetical protein
MLKWGRADQPSKEPHLRENKLFVVSVSAKNAFEHFLKEALRLTEKSEK